MPVVLGAFAFGQVHVKGKSHGEIAPLANALVVVKSGTDTVYAGRTDMDGHAIHFPIKVAGSCEILVSAEGYYGQSVVFRELSVDSLEATWISDFVLERNERRACTLGEESGDHWMPFFEPGSDQVNTAFDISNLEQMLKDNPEICLEFSLAQLPGDSKSLGQSRIKLVNDLFQSNQVCKDRIVVSEIIRVVKSDDPDQRSRFEGAIVSTDGSACGKH